MHYIELTCKLDSNAPELLSAYLINGLGDIGYESFDENEKIIKAYIPENDYSEVSLDELLNEIPQEFGRISYEVLKIEQQNWNEEWERHFNPVLIDDTVLIKASFHQNLPQSLYEIIIDPKMSFGTGHHSTTALMIKMMITMDFKNKDVLDMGCGTGVLAILAHKLGASHVSAVDIDEWAVNNAKENLQHNSIKNFEIWQGGAETLTNNKFDVILANINRNILVNDMPAYANSLKKGGLLILSGFLPFRSGTCSLYS